MKYEIISMSELGRNYKIIPTQEGNYLARNQVFVDIGMKGINLSDEIKTKKDLEEVCNKFDLDVFEGSVSNEELKEFNIIGFIYNKNYHKPKIKEEVQLLSLNVAEEIQRQEGEQDLDNNAIYSSSIKSLEKKGY